MFNQDTHTIADCTYSVEGVGVNGMRFAEWNTIEKLLCSVSIRVHPWLYSGVAYAR
jgi:hypothetical protein